MRAKGSFTFRAAAMDPPPYLAAEGGGTVMRGGKGGEGDGGVGMLTQHWGHCQSVGFRQVSSHGQRVPHAHRIGAANPGPGTENGRWLSRGECQVACGERVVSPNHHPLDEQVIG